MPRPTDADDLAGLALVGVRLGVAVRFYDSDGSLVTLQPTDAADALLGLCTLAIFPPRHPDLIRGYITAAAGQVGCEYSADEVEKIVAIVLERDYDDGEGWKRGDGQRS